jgi:RHS repeat-associated protein
MGETTTTAYGLNPNTWGDPLLHTTNNPKYTLSPMGKNVVYDYDENLRKVGQNVALGTADFAYTGFAYDDTGNLKKITDPRGHVTEFDYDSRNRKIWMNNPIASNRNANGHTMDWEYDEAGNKKKETRADNAFRSWKYDTMNRLSEATDWRMGGWEPAVTTRYTQSVDGRTRQVTDSKGAIYTTFYDSMNRQSGACYPPDAAGAGRCESWQYDAAGNVERHDSVAGRVQSFVYDNRNRRTQSYWWDHVGPHIRTGYDAASRVTSITTAHAGVFESSVAFGYDEANRKVAEEQTLSGYPTRRVETPRDADGNRKHLEVPGWYQVKYVYTERNQLKQIQDGNGGPWFNYTYDVAGNLTKRHDPYGGVNDSINVPSGYYDPLNRPVMWENTKAADAAYARSWYQYDMVGREVATWRDEEWSPSGGRGDRFDFNLHGQLTRARYSAEQVWTGNAFNPVSTEQYQINALNRESVTRNGVVTAYAPPSGLNQYQAVGNQTLGYDGNFNLASYDGALFTHDAQNRLVSANKGGATVAFVYDGLGRCVKRTVNGSATVITYDDWKPIMEWDGAGNFQAWNIYGPGPDEILWRHQTGVGQLRYHHDRKGNVTTVQDWWGNIVEKYTYDAFGRPVITDWWGNGHYDANGRYASWYGNRFMFQGREWIAELGIYDYRHRMYHPGLGRFLQTDPLGLQTEGAKLDAGQKALFWAGTAPEAFTTSEMNLYRYCGDDPVNRNDPFGLIDREISRELDKKGAEASQNSLEAAKKAGDGVGRSQAIQEKNGKLSLGRITKGKNGDEIIKKSVPGGFRSYLLQKEGAVVDKGSNPAGVGHVHMDKTGKADPNFSDTDRDTARGSADRAGIPVYKVNESNPNQIHRLTPQVDYRDEPTIRLVSP